MVSASGSAGTTARCPARSASTTRTTRPGGVRARAASWTSTKSGSSASATAAKARLTESPRFGSAGDDGRFAAEDQLGLVGAVSGYRHHDVIDDTGLQQAVDGAFDQGAAVELTERLGNTGSQPLARASGRNDCDRAGRRSRAPERQGIQDAAARTSSRMMSALASSVLSASANSPTRI